MNLSFIWQIGNSSGNELKGVKEVPLWDIIQESNAGIGWLINLFLVLMFAYVIFVFVERYFALRKASKEDSDFLSQVKQLLTKGDIENAKKKCVSSDSPSARMLEKGISRIGKPMESIAASIENTGKLEVLRLEQRLSFLATAAGAAPMLGFLGTVIGMMVVFIDLQNTATLELKVIAPGIMTAMVTTVAGLIVGIIAFMGYNYLVGRIGKVVYQMENAALEFMDLLNQPGK
ncbi:MAG: MotA/TolQ/ExbB proton channel family protein [Flavobacteriia bacterium]|nr:MotA/TolQ/ExbB proton channel family protein [Flavobacteriia bacterium]